MIITFARYYDWEGYSFEGLDTEKDSESIKRYIDQMIDGADIEIISILDPSTETLGEDLYAYYSVNKQLKDAQKTRRSESSKKAWEHRKANSKL